ncbi:MAG: TIGR04076 family protein [Candidatus Thorarchaeota archaeon]
MPEDFCSWAWEDLRMNRYLLGFGGDIPDTEDGVVFVSCSDGKRPVVFKLERIDS